MRTILEKIDAVEAKVDQIVDIDDDELVEYIQYVQICRERDHELYAEIIGDERG